MMKYFTMKDWTDSQDIFSFDINRIIQAENTYREYLESIKDRLPPDYLRLTETIHLGDARLREMEIDLNARCAVLVLDAEDLLTRPEGRRVALRFEQVRRVRSTSDPEQGLAGPAGFGDLGSEEIELLEDESWEHRFLFSSGIELAVQYGRFRFDVLQVTQAR